MRIIPLFKSVRAASAFGLVVVLILLLAGCGSPEDRAKSYYDNGMKLMAAHDNARAAIEFKNAVRAKKDYLPAWRALAKIAESEGNRANWIALLRTIIELDPKDIDDRVKLGHVLMLVGAGTDESLKLANEASEIDNRNAAAPALKAAILFNRGDTKGAVQMAQTALELDPKNSTAMTVMAADTLNRGDTKGALQILDQAGTQTDDLGVELFKLKIFERTQDLQRIEALLRELVQRYPNQLGYRRELVRLYVYQHRQDDAIKEQKDIVAALPNDITAELDLVRLLYTFSGAAAARQELVTHIAAGSDVFSYQLALADFDFAQGNFDSSVELLKHLISTATSSENIVAAQIKLAEFYLNKKQVTPAEALVTDVLRKDSRNTAGLRLRATIRLDRSEFEPAINDLREALNDQPRSPPLMLLLASAYERSGSIELAEKQFADAMRAADFNPTVGLDYVAFLQRRGSFDRAQDVLTELVNRFPQNVQILSALAQLKLQRQDWTGAQQIADTIRRLPKNAVLADQISGAALLGQNKFNESISALQEANAADPSALTPMADLVNAYLRAKQPDKAKAFLQSALKANPKNADAYTLLGLVALASNQPEEAIRNFNTAIATDPKDSNGYRALAQYYLAKQDVDSAQNTIRAGLAQRPDSADLHLVMASILEFKGDFEGAIAEYQSMLEKDPGSLIVANNLASLLTDRRTDQASLARAQSIAAVLQKSPLPPFKDTLGWISYRKGDYTTAIPLLEQAAAALPNRAVIHYHLGMAYSATKQVDKAVEQFNAALNQAPDAELKEKIQAAIKKSAS